MVALLAIIIGVVTINNNLNNETITYNVFFDNDGGTTIANQIIEQGNKVEKPNDPEKRLYT